MAKRVRKPLSSSIQKDIDEKKASKEKRAEEVIEALAGNTSVSEPQETEPVEPLSKLTVLIPESHHDKIRRVALDKKTKIRNLIIDFIDQL